MNTAWYLDKAEKLQKLSREMNEQFGTIKTMTFPLGKDYDWGYAILMRSLDRNLNWPKHYPKPTRRVRSAINACTPLYKDILKWGYTDIDVRNMFAGCTAYTPDYSKIENAYYWNKFYNTQA
jgi:hypothetical protein